MHRTVKNPRTPTICVASLIAFAPTLFGCHENAQGIYGPVPEWARTGNFSFARWDGGPIEVSKGVLSGWPGFVVPDPQVIYATENLYDPRTIELIQHAHVNWI